MPATAASRPFRGVAARWELLPVAIAGILFIALFTGPLVSLAKDWWNDPEAGHGLLLAPLALWLAWKKGIRKDATPSIVFGTCLLLGSIVLRYLGGLAAEAFTTRVSAMIALGGLVSFAWGWRQLLTWWLPVTLLALSVPLPSLITTALALPLQLKASAMGAALLEARNVPVRLSGNVLVIPQHTLFVTEACSGLRSLTALLSLGVLVGGMWLRYPLVRLLLIALAIPVAIVINAVRVFLTGFLVFFVSPAMGDGFMHATEGWLMFVVALAILGALAWLLAKGERRFSKEPAVE